MEATVTILDTSITLGKGRHQNREVTVKFDGKTYRLSTHREYRKGDSIKVQARGEDEFGHPNYLKILPE